MRTKTMAAIVLAIFGLMFMAGIAGAADKPAAPATVGFVDVQKIFYDCDEAKTGTAALQAESNKLQNKLERMLEHSLLPDDQRAEVEKLDAIDKPSDVQAKRIKELDDESKKIQDELRTLQQTPETALADAQKARLNELTTRGRQATQRITETRDTFSKQLADRNQEMSTRIQDKIKAAIADVAKTKAIVAVVDKQVILFGGTDLTDDVMKAVNKK